MYLILSVYLLINISYSRFKLKRFKIIGLTIVAIGFPLRFMFGSLALNLAISDWGVVLLFQLALFMLAGKRYQTQKRHNIAQQFATMKNSETDFWLFALVLLGSLFTASYVGFIQGTDQIATWGKGPLLVSTIPLGLGLLRYLEIVTHPEHFKTMDATEGAVRDSFLRLIVVVYLFTLSFNKLFHGF
jgi:4-hydroxybenzoate polyprenyltransferase